MAQILNILQDGISNKPEESQMLVLGLPVTINLPKTGALGEEFTVAALNAEGDPGPFSFAVTFEPATAIVLEETTLTGNPVAVKLDAKSLVCDRADRSRHHDHRNARLARDRRSDRRHPHRQRDPAAGGDPPTCATSKCLRWRSWNGDGRSIRSFPAMRIRRPMATGLRPLAVIAQIAAGPVIERGLRLRSGRGSRSPRR